MKLKNILNEGMGEKFIKALSKDAKVSPDDFKKMIDDGRITWKYAGATNVGIFIDGKKVSSVGPNNAIPYGIGKKGYHTHKDQATHWAKKIGIKQHGH